MKRNEKLDLKKHASFVQSTKDKLLALESKLKEKGYDLQFPLKD